MAVVVFDSSTDRFGQSLEIGQQYTRDQLADLWGYKSRRALETGCFTPKGENVIVLFITKEKPASISYEDDFNGHFLIMDGQEKHGTDRRMADSYKNGDTVYFFFRETVKTPFTFVGEVEFRDWKEHEDRPSRFEWEVVERVRARSTPKEKSASKKAAFQKAINNPDFDPKTTDDRRRKVLRTIAERRGQSKFRNALLIAYNHKCAISGCGVTGVLEAAHIVPHLGDHTDTEQNGLLLRADLHTLFDLKELTISDDYRVQISDKLKGTEYESLVGKKIGLPDDPGLYPNIIALQRHRS